MAFLNFGYPETVVSNYQLKVSPEKLHSLLFYASMFVGDSQTMTSEAAILGTPAIKCNTFAGNLSVPNEIEDKYGLCFSFLPEQENEMVEKIKSILLKNDFKKEWQKRREIMFRERIDVTGFMIWLVDEYPESIHLLQNKEECNKLFKNFQ